MKNSIIFFLLCAIIIYMFYIINYNLSKENFYIQTWTPYFIDRYYQPHFNNYFYYDGYLYPYRVETSKNYI